ncbi:MAG: undecaprenyl/decaprenyl-phosphate alpha-N-acetylglucosaminyl 1-phosphate transferase [Lentisphaeria bacterium]|nr:undecaprenyl/decaprenyl-phosphate alpha-N-acetylglucosaminyl 1-phosphate transferase [Lentisphaeria bacterium]
MINKLLNQFSFELDKVGHVPMDSGNLAIPVATMMDPTKEQVVDHSSWIVGYLLVLVAASIVSYMFTHIFKKLSFTFNFLDVPMREGHKLHTKATPLLGGAAMLSAWLTLIGVGLALVMSKSSFLPSEIKNSINGIKTTLPLIGVIAAGAVAIGVMGLFDDKKPMGWKFKMSLQAIICGLVVLYPKLQVFHVLNNTYISWFLTLFWFLFIINAFNFFDNMDGLAAGVAMIASGIFASIAILNEQFFVATLGLVTAGVAFGYYIHNSFPASIFMGDAGSHFLGYLLATQAVLTQYLNDSTETYAPVLIPLVVLAMPIFDTFAVVIIRLRKGLSPFKGDHNHVSHRFLRMGVSKKTAVALVHCITLILGLSAINLLFADLTGVIVTFIQIFFLLLVVTILHMKVNKEKSS